MQFHDVFDLNKMRAATRKNEVNYAMDYKTKQWRKIPVEANAIPFEIDVSGFADDTEFGKWWTDNIGITTFVNTTAGASGNATKNLYDNAKAADGIAKFTVNIDDINPAKAVPVMVRPSITFAMG